jgi:hypothetical protein
VKLPMSKTDLEILRQIVEENEIQYFNLQHEGDNGIGYTTTIEWETKINGRIATVTMCVAGQENW